MRRGIAGLFIVWLATATMHAGAALDVEAREGDDHVVLRIRLEEPVDPGSIDIRLDGRTVVVRARSRDGERLRSPTLRVAAPLVEEGATAKHSDGWLTVTLRKQQPR